MPRCRAGPTPPAPRAGRRAALRCAASAGKQSRCPWTGSSIAALAGREIGMHRSCQCRRENRADPVKSAPMRLNKYIGETGFCSRREADRLIAERRVTVNGEPAGMGTQVEEGDEVRIDGQGLKARGAAPKGKRRHVYIALNK